MRQENEAYREGFQYGTEQYETNAQTFARVRKETKQRMSSMPADHVADILGISSESVAAKDTTYSEQLEQFFQGLADGFRHEKRFIEKELPRLAAKEENAREIRRILDSL